MEAAAETLWRLSFFVGLPFLVPVPADSTLTILEETSPGIDLEVDPRLGPVLHGALPTRGTSVWFRHVERPFDALAVAFEAFRDVFDHQLGRSEGVPPGDDSDAPKSGRTVVQLTRFTPGPPSLEAFEQGWDTRAEEDETAGRAESADTNEVTTHNWLSVEFDAAVQHLNLQLVTLATVSSHVSFGPVALRSLPPLVPYLLSLLELPSEGESEPYFGLFHLHQFPESVLGDVISPEAFAHAGRIASLEHREGHAYLALAEALVEARRAVAQGRTAHAVLETGVVAELLVTTTLREAAQSLGGEPAASTVLVKSPFIHRATMHLPALLGMSCDVASRDDPIGHWKQCAYDLRNRVTHEGYRPTGHEAEHALLVTRGLINAVASALALHDDTRWLADLLVG